MDAPHLYKFMTIIEQSEELRQHAITLLLDERDAIEQQLTILGHGQEKTAPGKRRGRPKKSLEEGPQTNDGHQQSA
jgi:hypothetical protein